MTDFVQPLRLEGGIPTNQTLERHLFGKVDDSGITGITQNASLADIHENPILT